MACSHFRAATTFSSRLCVDCGGLPADHPSRADPFAPSADEQKGIDSVAADPTAAFYLIQQLRRQLVAAQKRESDRSWLDNPDRMGS